MCILWSIQFVFQQETKDRLKYIHLTVFVSRLQEITFMRT